MKSIPRRVEKPWGHELIWAETELYVGKILHVKAGQALSVQMHEIKDETLHLLSGAIEFELFLSASNILFGIGLSIFVGIVSGVIPAMQASGLDPVVAMRQ